jgi:murein L,D-transpeptidase YcbB/YkuD
MITLRQPAACAAGILASALLCGAAWAESHAAPLPTEPAVTEPAEIITLAPVAEALRVSLALGGDDADVERAFYAARSYRPVWIADDGTALPAARILLNWAGDADAHALPVERYGVTGLAARVDGARAGEYSNAAALETDLTALYLTFARDVSSGLLEPRKLGHNFDIRPRRQKPAALLASLGAAADVSAHLDALVPQHPGYSKLQKLYAAMRVIALEGGWGPQIAKGGTLRPGDRSDRIEQLRARLIAIGDLAPEEKIATGEVMNDATDPAPDPRLFDVALEAGVRRFQERHGLNTDGAVGSMTLAALNTTAAERAAQAAVGLERMRWMNHDLGARHIFINTAAFTMQVFENGQPVFYTRTVVGKSRKHQTPEFNDELEYIVVNPYWNVPYSIASKEILPLLQKDPTYLEQNNMELLNSDLPPSMIDWTQVTRGSFPGRIRQRPGAGNALGSVKFLFPNKHSIYMHDTPSRRLFARDRRAYSHGCVRLQNPTEFAHLLLGLQYDNPVGTFDRLQARSGEQWVTMEQPIPVYVTYRTAWLADDGKHNFRADVYRRDRDVIAALSAAGVSVLGE